MKIHTVELPLGEPGRHEVVLLTDHGQALAKMLAERDAAQAQLAEAVGLLREVNSQRFTTLATVEIIESFIGRHSQTFHDRAQAEHQETQGVQAGDEREAFEAWHRGRFGTKSQTGDPTRDMHNGVKAEEYGPEEQQIRWECWQARAALPSQPATGDSIQVEAVAVTREDEDGLYLDWVLEGGISALEAPGVVLLVAHGEVTDDQGSGEVYLVPPAAAHGDELVAVVGTVPGGSGFKSLDFKVELESLPDGTRLYAQGAGGAST